MIISWCLRALLESGSIEAPWNAEEVLVSDSTSYFILEIVGEETLGPDMRPTRLLGVNVGYSALTYFLIFICSAFGMFLPKTKRILIKMFKEHLSKVFQFSFAIGRD